MLWCLNQPMVSKTGRCAIQAALAISVGCGVTTPADVDALGGALTGIADHDDDSANVDEPSDGGSDAHDDPDAPTPTGEEPRPADERPGSCTSVGCPQARPFCGDAGQCLQCRDALDCDAASCEAGSCESLPAAGRLVWLRASDLVANTTVAQWTSVGDGAAAQQADPTQQPTVMPAVLGGGNAVWFDGDDDRLTLDDTGAYATASAHTIVVVIVAQSDGHIVGPRSSGGGPALLAAQGRPYVAIDGAPTLWPAEHFVPDAPRIVTVHHDATGAALSLEGLLAAQVADAPTTPGSDPTVLGANDQDTAFGGGIAELLIFDRRVSDAELARIHRYLMQRHGVRRPDPWATLAADASIFYPMDEVGPGARQDVLGNLPITPFPSADGTTAVPGMVGQAQHVDGANGDFHFFRNGGDPRLDHSTGSFTWAGWVAVDPLDPAAPYLESQTLVGKWDPPSQCQLRVWYEPMARTWSVSVSPTGQQSDAITLTHPHAVDPGAFVLVQAWRNALTSELGLRVSDPGQLGPAVTVGMADTLPITGNDLNVAAHATCSDGFLQGTIDALGQWRRPLTEAESAVLVEGFEPPIAGE